MPFTEGEGVGLNELAVVSFPVQLCWAVGSGGTCSCLHVLVRRGMC